LGLVDLANLELEIKIPEAFADEVSIGTPVEAWMDNKALPASVTRIAPEVAQGQVIARVAFRGGNPPGLRQNQRVSSRVIVGERDSVLHVPRGPFLQNGGGKMIYVQKGDYLERHELVTGFVGVSQVEILSGVEAGDVIVLNDLSEFDGAPSLRVLP
jgi:HlyD family secretion protein